MTTALPQDQETVGRTEVGSETELLRIAPRTARQGERVRRPTRTEPALVAANGEDAVFLTIADGSSTVGRSFRADLELEDVSVSRRHATLVRNGASVDVLDDRSANGVFVNGERVMRATLSDGDLVQFGRIVLRFVAAD